MNPAKDRRLYILYLLSLSELFSYNSILEPIGLAARDTLRLEMGYCLYGNDINEEISPIQAGLSWIVNMQKDFIGKEVLKQQINQGVPSKLIAFQLTERRVEFRN